MHALAPETRGNLDRFWRNLVGMGSGSDIARRLRTLSEARAGIHREALYHAQRSAEHFRADDAGREAIEEACWQINPNMAWYGWTPDPAEHFAQLRADLSGFAESASKALARVPALRSLLREHGGELNGAPLATALAESLAAVEQAARSALDSLSHPDRYPGDCAKTLDDHGPTITKAAERLRGICAILPDRDTGVGDRTPLSNAGEGGVSAGGGVDDPDAIPKAPSNIAEESAGPALTVNQSRVLQTMARFDASRLLSAKMIAEEMDARVRLSEETVRQSVRKLIESNLAERPEGDRSGARLNRAGRKLAGKIVD